MEAQAPRRFEFDYNAGGQPDPRVLAYLAEVAAGCRGNASSLHTTGRRARGRLEEARERVAAALGVPAASVVFVSGGTEANNLVVLGHGDLSRPVLLAPSEHASVLAPAAHRGAVEWAVDATGSAVVTPPPDPVGLVCLVHGQSEVGTLQPIAAAGALARALGVPFHVDASQTLGRCALDEVVATADTITLSTHKAGGVVGSGVLIDRSERRSPLLHGGGQQRDRRPGTEPVALCLATALAVELAVAETASRATAMRRARDAFLDALDLATSPGVHRVTPAHSLPNTVMLRFDDVTDGRQLLPALDLAGIDASHGSACSSGAPTPPAILRAIGFDDAASRRCVRFSFSPTSDARYAADGGHLLCAALSRLRTS
ncbi:MAG: aminotransferase class V-fold PLP-dependent enzyme [Planctomycetes bacterium]|nr:aminotransferase class V-fold PLP-dependent enzyme [Planctomycetota bacterium]MCB9888156.1 aminotransferase class V-fold PLP-dependent enzyme [Planctomycetota bacterium]